MADLPLPLLQDMLDWLWWQSPGHVIGQRLVAQGCALHTWLLTIFRGPVVVDEETVQVGRADGTTVSIATPDDYRAVMQRLDYLGGFENDIRVDEARAALRDVLDEYRED